MTSSPETQNTIEHFTSLGDDTASTAQLAISGELGLILLGCVLLGLGSFVFLKKLCGSLSSGGGN